jgi:hypothetical protein
MSWTRTFPGTVAPDVAILNGQVHLVSGPSPWTWRTFDAAGTEQRTRTQSLGYYPKTNGHVSVAHDGVRYLYWPLDGEPAVNPAAKPWGNNPTGLSPLGVRAWQAYPDVVVVAGEDVRHDTNAARPTGLWEVHDDGTYVRMDDANRSEPWAGGYVYHAPGGRLVVAESGERGIVGELDGVRVHLWPGQDTKWPRASVEGDLVAICSWGDPGPATRLWVGTVAELLAYAVPPPVLPPVPPELAGRELWCGYFFALSDRYGDNLTAPGNCTVALTETEAARSPWPYFAPPGVAQGPRKIGSLISVPRGEPWPDAAFPTDVLLYDGGNVLPETPSGAITALECYCEPDEPVIAVDARLREWLRRWPAAPVILVGQAYDRNGTETNLQKLCDLQAIPLEIAVDFPQIKGILWFSE